MFNRFFQWIAIALVVFSQWGCTGENAGNGNDARAQSYDNDGYLGLTNTNPNYPTSPSYHTYKVDAQSIRRAAMKVKGVTGVNVSFFGGQAYVRLQLADGIGKKEADRIKAEALKQITFEMPRYPVSVTVNQS